MKTRFASAILIFLLVILFFGCKEDANEGTFNPSKKLYAKSGTQKSVVRLFTNGVEIKNQTVINNFLKNSNVFNLNLNGIDKGSYITFSASDTAIFKNDNSSYSEKYSIVKNNNQFLFYSGDVFAPAGQPFMYFKDMLKHTYPEKFFPGSNGIPNGITKLIKVGYGSFNQVEISLLSYKFTQNFNGNKYFIQQSGLSNEFNEAVILKLGLSDTLAVQEFSLRYN